MVFFSVLRAKKVVFHWKKLTSNRWVNYKRVSNSYQYFILRWTIPLTWATTVPKMFQTVEKTVSFFPPSEAPPAVSISVPKDLNFARIFRNITFFPALSLPSALKKFAAPVTCQASGYILSVLYCSFILWLIKAQRGPWPYLHRAGGRVLICTGTEHDRNWGVQCHKMTFLTWHPP